VSCQHGLTGVLCCFVNLLFCSIWWQFIPYFLLGMSEVFTSEPLERS
jgi:hypothetical protein